MGILLRQQIQYFKDISYIVSDKWPYEVSQATSHFSVQSYLRSCQWDGKVHSCRHTVKHIQTHVGWCQWQRVHCQQTSNSPELHPQIRVRTPPGGEDREADNSGDNKGHLHCILTPTPNPKTLYRATSFLCRCLSWSRSKKPQWAGLGLILKNVPLP